MGKQACGEAGVGRGTEAGQERLFGICVSLGRAAEAFARLAALQWDGVAQGGCERLPRSGLAAPLPVLRSGSSEICRGWEGWVVPGDSFLSLCSRATFRNLLLYLLSSQCRRGCDKPLV